MRWQFIDLVVVEQIALNFFARPNQVVIRTVVPSIERPNDSAGLD
jgi:hypothetical protein